MRWKRVLHSFGDMAQCLRTRKDLSWQCYGLGTFMIVPVIKLRAIDGRMAVSPVDIKQSKNATAPKTLPKKVMSVSMQRPTLIFIFSALQTFRCASSTNRADLFISTQ